MHNAIGGHTTLRRNETGGVCCEEFTISIKHSTARVTKTVAQEDTYHNSESSQDVFRGCNELNDSSSCVPSFPTSPSFIAFKSVDSERSLHLSEANGNISNDFSSVRIWLHIWHKRQGWRTAKEGQPKRSGFCEWFGRKLSTMHRVRGNIII